jgi:hypothetical protein
MDINNHERRPAAARATEDWTAIAQRLRGVPTELKGYDFVSS